MGNGGKVPGRERAKKSGTKQKAYREHSDGDLTMASLGFDLESIPAAGVLSGAFARGALRPNVGPLVCCRWDFLGRPEIPVPKQYR